MKQVVVLSGKGGTGKTSFLASFAALAGECVLADCDVDASNLAILAGGAEGEEEPFFGEGTARVDPERCSLCGKCEEACRFHAVSLPRGSGGEPAGPARVVEIACEGCGLCAIVCPEGAISMVDRRSGTLVVSESRHGPIVHARLLPGEGNSGKLVAMVREKAKEIASREGRDLVLVDGSPGIGCPVISSLAAVDGAFLVVEPSVSALHDLERIHELLERFRIRACLVLNKFDLQPEVGERILAFCREAGIFPAGKAAFDPLFLEALQEGRSVVEFAPGSRAAREVEEAWRKGREFLNI